MKKYMLLTILLGCFVSLSVVIACGDNGFCAHRKYGHRRALLQNPEVSIPIGDDSAQAVNYKSYFQAVAEKALTLRKHLLADKALGKIKNQQEADEKLTSRYSNVVSFGFVFFDEEGKCINKEPFHFFPEVTSDTPKEELEKYYFFFSGRRQRDYAPSKGDTYRWTALPQKAPTSSDLAVAVEQSLAKELLSANKSLNHIEEIFQRERSKDMTAALGGYSYGSYKLILYEKAQAVPFFDYIANRYERYKKDSDKQLCSLFIPLLSPPGNRTAVGGVFYPTSADKSNFNKEGDFTHSEQWALFQASLKRSDNGQTNFEIFMDACVRALGANAKKVASYAVLIYTYNVMCVRCAQSTVIDFTLGPSAKGSSLNRIINTKLNTISEQEGQRPMVFIAGYSKDYQSTLYKQPMDSFERRLPGPGAEPPEVDLTLAEPWKLSAPYEQCVMRENNDQMIYHVKLKDSSVQGAAHKNVSDADDDDHNGDFFDLFKGPT